MSEPTTASVAGVVAANGIGPALSAEEIAQVLADFRLWLIDAAVAPAPPAPADAVDLFTLVSQFTALRQELNLQTRAARSQQEQNNEALRQNTETLQALQKAEQQLAAQNEAARQQELEGSVRPLLKALVDVADSQMLAARELVRTAQTILQLLTNPGVASQCIKSSETKPLPPAPSGGFLARLFGINRLANYQRELASHLKPHGDPSEPMPALNVAEQIGRILDSAIVGLNMGLQRIEQAMRQFDLQPIQAVGQPFDPERMEAVEVVANSNRPAGEVIDEVRRGYLWKGKVFRFAQVRVSK